MLLSHAALKTTECTALLKSIREGERDCVTERLETLLDVAVIDLAREYSASRDLYGGATSALLRVREYRATYPHKSSLASVDLQVATALAISTAPVQAQEPNRR